MEGLKIAAMIISIITLLVVFYFSIKHSKLWPLTTILFIGTALVFCWGIGLFG